MNKTPMWARVFGKTVTFGFLALLGLSAAMSAGAQDQPTLVELSQPKKVNDISCRYFLAGPLPSSSTTEKFSPWTKMHPHTFNGHLNSFVEQCKSTVGELPWLTDEVCNQFGIALQQGNCAVVSTVNNINLDVVRGIRDGRSRAFLYEHMQLQESRQAIFVSLPGNIWLGMFTGEPESCNNFFGLKEKSLPPLRIPTTVQPEKKCRFVLQEEIQTPGIFTYVPDYDYCGCHVPGFVGFAPGGTQSSSTLVCDE